MNIAISISKCPICYDKYSPLKIVLCKVCKISICNKCIINIYKFNYTNCPQCRCALDINRLSRLNRYLYGLYILFKYVAYTYSFYYFYNMVESLL